MTQPPPRQHCLDMHGQRMVLELHGFEAGRRTAVVAHGLHGAPDQVQMTPVIAACRAAGLAVIAPNLRNSNANRSDGNSQSFTMTGAVEDLAAVLNWTQRRAPLALVAGHSMGGYAALRVAAETPDVPAVLAISPVTSGRLLIKAHEDDGSMDLLDREVPRAREEWPLHDLMPLTARITQPVALMVGALDHLTQVAHVAALQEKLSNVVFWRVLHAEPHCPVGPEYAPALAAAVKCLL